MYLAFNHEKLSPDHFVLFGIFFNQKKNIMKLTVFCFPADENEAGIQLALDKWTKIRIWAIKRCDINLD